MLVNSQHRQLYMQTLSVLFATLVSITQEQPNHRILVALVQTATGQQLVDLLHVQMYVEQDTTAVEEAELHVLLVRGLLL